MGPYQDMLDSVNMLERVSGALNTFENIISNIERDIKRLAQVKESTDYAKKILQDMKKKELQYEELFLHYAKGVKISASELVKKLEEEA
jgi:prefoldin subunit 5